MTLGNMREPRRGPPNRLLSDDARRHQTVIDVSSHPAKTGVPVVPARVKCSNTAASAWNVELQPNWKELPARPMKLLVRVGEAPPPG